MSNEDNAVTGLVKIVFKLRAEDGYPPVGYESVWGLKNRDGSCTISNTPMYIYGISKGDVISVLEDAGELTPISVRMRGGHSTIRVFAEQADQKKAIIKFLNLLGAACTYSEGQSLFSVDIPPESDFIGIDKYLSGIAVEGEVEYEDACLQHSGLEETRYLECSSLATIPQQYN